MSVLLREFLAHEIQGLNDPRFSCVTITDVDVAKDLKTAWVYWAEHFVIPAMKESPSESISNNHKSSLMDRQREQGIKNINEAFSNVSVLLRKRVGQELKFRFCPVLHFKYDESIERGFRIDQLLNQATKNL